ncbi:MAG: peptidylprolyl isomerase, partial [Pseudomonadota bacterium]
AFVREEVLYREALRLGLDESDAIVRRRLVSKMDLSASLAAETAEPTEAVLRAFLDKNAERYAAQSVQRGKVSFDQLFYPTQAEATAALSASTFVGEATSLPPSVEAAAPREVASRFGAMFAEALSGLEPADGWQGPVQSSFGWHLVKLKERNVPPPDFETLRAVLANDWRSDQIQQRKERAYETLRSAYRIDIDR